MQYQQKLQKAVSDFHAKQHRYVQREKAAANFIALTKERKEKKRLRNGGMKT